MWKGDGIYYWLMVFGDINYWENLEWRKDLGNSKSVEWEFSFTKELNFEQGREAQNFSILYRLDRYR